MIQRRTLRDRSKRLVTDIIIIVIFFLLFLLGLKRGIAVTILNIAGIAVVGFLAYGLGGMLSSWIYSSFIQQSLINNIQNTVNAQGIDAAISGSFAALPDWVRGIVNLPFALFGGDASVLTQDFNIASNAVNSAATSIEQLVQPFVVSILKLMIGTLFTIVLFIPVKIIINRLAKLFRVPVVKQINQFLGGVLGLAESAVFVFFAVNIYSGFLYFANPDMLANPMISGAIFKFFSVLV